MDLAVAVAVGGADADTGAGAVPGDRPRHRGGPAAGGHLSPDAGGAGVVSEVATFTVQSDNNFGNDKGRQEGSEE